jgi:protein associated with RNAse G/E
MTSNPDKIIVVKMNPHREEVWRYEGRILNRSPHRLLIEAFFNKDEVSFQGITLRRRDRSIECFYNDRWYNILEIHDQEDDRLKFWYCNVTLPAEFSPGRIAYVDLALDVIVFPDGEYRILDEDEFEDLMLDIETKQQALKSQEVLVEMAQNGVIPKIFK